MLVHVWNNAVFCLSVYLSSLCKFIRLEIIPYIGRILFGQVKGQGQKMLGSLIQFVSMWLCYFWRHLVQIHIFQIFTEGQVSFPEFRFVEQNGWPVSAKQEESLCVLDVWSGGRVSISSDTARFSLPWGSLQSNTNTQPYKACTVR